MRAAPRPTDARLRSASRWLAAGVLVQSVTLAWLAVSHGTTLDSLLFMEIGAREAVARRADLALAAAVVAGAAFLAARPHGLAGLFGASLVSACFLTVAVATSAVGGRAFAQLSPLSHAVRWLAPWALLFLGARDGASVRSASWVLRAAVAATFLGHGWEALRAHPAFVDLLLGSARRWLDTAPPESSARRVLFVIGAVDVAVALLVLAARWRAVVLWAAVWGLATALSRTVALGHEFLFESTLRALNGIAPLVLWLVWTVERPSSDPQASP